jgi:hypothetical protein
MFNAIGAGLFGKMAGKIQQLTGVSSANYKFKRASRFWDALSICLNYQFGFCVRFGFNRISCNGIGNR